VTRDAAAASAAAVAEAFRAEWGAVLATVIRVTGDWDLAEECAQDAYARALERWPVDGVPDRPGAWLTTVARNRALDVLRRSGTEARKLREVATGASDESRAGPMPVDEPEERAGDDRLRLIFTCCHPALSLEARVALTLRTLAGLTTAEIARAFLVSEATMAKRLVRAKHKIQHAGIPYRVPPPELLAERTGGVLAVLYLLFNEGYAAARGDDLLRADLCGEAVRLAEALAAVLPEEVEVAGLVALLHLHHARRDGRVDERGDLVTLDAQDRKRWDRSEIDRALAVLDRALLAGGAGPYVLQAQVAACHARAADASDTDWPAIVRLYGQLAALQPSPVVELNRAVAIAMAEGAGAGLAAVDGLPQGALAGYHLLHATRADLLRRLGCRSEAAASYARALELVTSEPERRFLERRLEEVADPTR